MIGSLLVAGVVGFFLCTTVSAAALVNINTAASSELETLVGIGPSKAAAIIDYRNTYGVFGTIEDIQNVSGIGATTFANIKDSITVGSSAPSTQTQSNPTPTTVSTTASSSRDEVVEAPKGIAISAPSIAYVHSPVTFDLTVSGGDGALVRYTWNFGDGTTESTNRPTHTFEYAGKYVVVVESSYQKETLRARKEIMVLSPTLTLEARPDGAVVITNIGKQEIDLGGYTLAGNIGSFTFAPYTIILAGSTLVRNTFDIATHGSQGSVFLHDPMQSVVAMSSPSAVAPPVRTGVVLGVRTDSPAPQIAATSTSREDPAPALAAVSTTELAAVSSAKGRPLPYFGLVAVLGLGVLGLYAKRAGITPGEEI